jgi:hypothetical protein
MGSPVDEGSAECRIFYTEITERTEDDKKTRTRNKRNRRKQRAQRFGGRGVGRDP